MKSQENGINLQRMMSSMMTALNVAYNVLAILLRQISMACCWRRAKVYTDCNMWENVVGALPISP